MTYLFPDAEVEQAIRDLEQGDGEALAALIESGKTAYLFKRMAGDARLRWMVAQCLRGKSPRTPGRKPAKDARSRNRFLIVRICYWAGAGVRVWQVEADDTACHRALNDYRSRHPQASPPGAETVYKEMWDKRTPDNFLTMQMVESFVDGMEASPPETASELHRRLKTAERHGLDMAQGASVIPLHVRIMDLFSQVEE